jgi:hypothetical protein
VAEQPADHEVGLEADQLADLDERQAGLPEVTDLAKAATGETGNMAGRPQGRDGKGI